MRNNPIVLVTLFIIFLNVFENIVSNLEAVYGGIIEKEVDSKEMLVCLFFVNQYVFKCHQQKALDQALRFRLFLM